MKKHFILLLFILFCFRLPAFSQGTTCQTSEMLCLPPNKVYPASVNSGSAQPGANYGCLYTRPNPAWFYFQIGNPGTIEITMQSSPARDIDFACWGPFTSQTTPCMAQLTAGSLTPSHANPGPSPYYPTQNMIDCSYSANPVEYLYVPNGQTGQFYILLITNYSNQSCNITVSQTGGTGTLNCNILPYAQGDTVCVGQTIHLSVNIPTPGATYSWTGPNGWTSNLMNPTIPNATPSMSGTYYVVITVGGQSSPPIPCNVIVGSYPTVTISTSTPSACLGNPFTLTGSSSEPNTTYHWSTGANQNPIVVSPSVPTTYSVTGTTQWGCTGTASVSVNVLPSPTVTVTANPPQVCGGSSDTLTAYGADTYTWSHGLGSGNPIVVIPPSSITYTVTGTDVNGCSASASVYVQSVGPPVMITASSYNVCAGTNVTLTGWFAQSYQWSHGLGTGSVVTHTPLVTTTYTVTGTNNDGCSASATRTVNVNPLMPVSVTISASPPGAICTGTSVTFTATPVNGGSSPGYQWLVNGNPVGSNSPTFTTNSLVNGDVVTCVLTSNITCPVGNPATSNPITMTVSNNLTAGVSITSNPPNPVCAGQWVTFTATPINGGIPSYQWLRNGIPVTGANGVTYSTNTLINGEVISCVMNSSLSCALGNPATSNPIIMSVSPVPDATINAAGPLCEGGVPVNLTAVNSGGIWAGQGIIDSIAGEFDPALAGAGTHTISYTLSNGICTDTGYYDLTVYPESNATIMPAGPFCVTDPPLTLISVDGGGIWLGNGITDNLLGIFEPAVAGAGTHLITYMVYGYCPDTGQTYITITNPANATINPPGNLCTGQPPVTLSAVTPGGIWSGAGITDSILGIFDPSVTGAGSYLITYLAGSGACADTGYINLNVYNSPDATINPPAGTFCSNGSPVYLSAVNPGGIWSGNGIVNTVTGLFNPGLAGTGSHVVYYTLSNGYCTGTDSVLIYIHQASDATIIPSGPYCFLDDADTLASVSAGGIWSGSGIINSSLGVFDPGVAGQGTHLITHIAGGICPDTATVFLTVTGFLSADITPAGPFCSNDSPVALQAASPGGIWSGQGITDAIAGIFSPSVAGAGTFEIVYSIAGNCGDSDTVTITVNLSPDATIDSIGLLCEGDLPVTLSAAQTGGIWSGDGITDSVNGTFNPAAGAGNYNVVYTLEGICSDSDTLTIVVHPQADASVQPAGPFCSNDLPVNLSAAQGGGIWSGNGITNPATGTFNPALADTGLNVITYAITGICGDTDTIIIRVYPSFTLAATVNHESCLNASDGSVAINVIGGKEPFSYQWTPGNATTPIIRMLAPGNYSVIVHDAHNCYASGTYNVQASDILCFEPLIYIPNIFSPNHDGKNDILYIKGQGIKEISFSVYNRWGEEVFHTTDINAGWNGTCRGKDVDNGVYVYYLKAVFINNKEVTQKGNITLIR